MLDFIWFGMVVFEFHLIYKVFDYVFIITDNVIFQFNLVSLVITDESFIDDSIFSQLFVLFCFYQAWEGTDLWHRL